MDEPNKIKSDEDIKRYLESLKEEEERVRAEMYIDAIEAIERKTGTLYG
jgi:hypothetical protein